MISYIDISVFQDLANSLESQHEQIQTDILEWARGDNVKIDKIPKMNSANLCIAYPAVCRRRF